MVAGNIEKMWMKVVKLQDAQDQEGGRSQKPHDQVALGLVGFQSKVCKPEIQKKIIYCKLTSPDANTRNKLTFLERNW